MAEENKLNALWMLRERVILYLLFIGPGLVLLLSLYMFKVANDPATADNRAIGLLLSGLLLGVLSVVTYVYLVAKRAYKQLPTVIANQKKLQQQKFSPQTILLGTGIIAVGLAFSVYMMVQYGEKGFDTASTILSVLFIAALLIARKVK